MKTEDDEFELYDDCVGCKWHLRWGKTLSDGNRQVELVFRSGKGVIVFKGFRVDRDYTVLLMPQTLLNRYGTSMVTAAISKDICDDILQVIQEQARLESEEGKKNAKATTAR